MRTTLDIDRDLLKEAVQIAGVKNYGEAVNRALEEYVRSQRIEELRAMRGKIQLAMSWQEMEQVEMSDHSAD